MSEDDVKGEPLQIFSPWIALVTVKSFKTSSNFDWLGCSVNNNRKTKQKNWKMNVHLAQLVC